MIRYKEMKKKKILTVVDGIRIRESLADCAHELFPLKRTKAEANRFLEYQ